MCNITRTLTGFSLQRITGLIPKTLGLLVYGPSPSVAFFSYVSSKTKQVNRQRRIFDKLLRDTKKKKWYPNAPGLVKSSKVTSAPIAKYIAPRRANVLNNLFMEHITEVMSTGEIGSHLQGYGIEISYVKVSSDYLSLNVYWLVGDCNPEIFNAAEKILFSLAGEIRNVLSSLRLMGHIPKIIFVRDKQYTYLTELEQRFAVADYGPDEPTIGTDENDTTLSEESNESDEDTEPAENQQFKTPDFLFAPPDMRQDIFRLNHGRMMNDVLCFRKKSDAAHKNADCPYVFHEVPSSPVSHTTYTAPLPNESEVSKVRDFMRRRMQEETKLRKQQRMVEQEEFRAEMERRKEEMLEDVDEPDDQPDYYEEESSNFYERDV